MSTEQPQSNRLYVGNIPWSTTVEELQGLFTDAENIEIPTGRQNRSRGYALVSFSDESAAQSAMQAMNGHALGDRNISVRADNPLPKAPKSSSRGGGSGGAPVQRPTNLPEAKEGCRCYVGNLAWETDEQALIEHCQTIGHPVLRCEVARQSGGRSKGWALIDFASKEAADAGVKALHDTECRARSIIVRAERPGGAAATKPPREIRPENSSGLQIVVRNLPWSTTSDDLRQVFQQVGTVVDAKSTCHDDTGRSKGWGTVLFETQEQAQAAIAGFNGVELEGRPMQIKIDRFE
jgi:RNA recognition motif-containing protein